MNNINMNLVKVNGKTREDLLTALRSLGEMDLDFCGANGSEYLWDSVDEDEYESNMEYLLDTIKEMKSDKKLIEKYVANWVGRDSYYSDYILDVIYDDNGKAECIALATMH